MTTKINNQQVFAVKLFKLGILISGTNSNGAVWDLDGNDISEQENIKALIAEHNEETEPEMPPPL